VTRRCSVSLVFDAANVQVGQVERDSPQMPPPGLSVCFESTRFVHKSRAIRASRALQTYVTLSASIVCRARQACRTAVPGSLEQARLQRQCKDQRDRTGKQAEMARRHGAGGLDIGGVYVEEAARAVLVPLEGRTGSSAAIHPAGSQAALLASMNGRPDRLMHMVHAFADSQTSPSSSPSSSPLQRGGQPSSVRSSMNPNTRKSGMPLVQP
jgi:hypothetical protein